MKTFLSFAIALSAFATVAVADTAVEAKRGNAQVGDPLPPIAAQLIDLSGGQEKTSAYDSKANQRVTAYVMLGTQCPSSKAYGERLAQLSEAYKAKADIIFVYPNREDSRETKLAFHKDKKLGGRLIDDQGGQVARLLGAQRTTEVFIADSKGKIVYRGGIDDSRDDVNAVKQRFVANALDQTLAGQPVTTATAPVIA